MLEVRTSHRYDLVQCTPTTRVRHQAFDQRADVMRARVRTDSAPGVLGGLRRMACLVQSLNDEDEMLGRRERRTEVGDDLLDVTVQDQQPTAGVSDGETDRILLGCSVEPAPVLLESCRADRARVLVDVDVEEILLAAERERGSHVTNFLASAFTNELRFAAVACASRSRWICMLCRPDESSLRRMVRTAWSIAFCTMRRNSADPSVVDRSSIRRTSGSKSLA